jgi:hypothetical protein
LNNGRVYDKKFRVYCLWQFLSNSQIFEIDFFFLLGINRNLSCLFNVNTSIIIEISLLDFFSSFFIFFYQKMCFTMLAYELFSPTVIAECVSVISLWWNITTKFMLEIGINTSDLLSAKSLRKIDSAYCTFSHVI